MGNRQIVLVSTAGFSVLNKGIFWREAKTKRLFSQCTYNVKKLTEKFDTLKGCNRTTIYNIRVSNKVSYIPVENFTINTELFRLIIHTSQVLRQS
jgi:hypothetical protein